MTFGDLREYVENVISSNDIPLDVLDDFEVELNIGSMEGIISALDFDIDNRQQLITLSVDVV